MGCGCGGNRKNISARARPASSQPPAIRPAPVVRQAQNQQNLVQQANVRNGLSALGGDRTEMERKRKIQVSLKNRNLKRPQ